MENKIDWLDSSPTGDAVTDEVQIDPLSTREGSMSYLMNWLGVETVEEAEAFLARESPQAPADDNGMSLLRDWLGGATVEEAEAFLARETSTTE